MTEERCGCGQPLHYTDKDAEAVVRALVEKFGPTVLVKVPYANVAVLVPRHYIALHGISAVEVGALAERYGWERV